MINDKLAPIETKYHCTIEWEYSVDDNYRTAEVISDRVWRLKHTPCELEEFDGNPACGPQFIITGPSKRAVAALRDRVIRIIERGKGRVTP